MPWPADGMDTGPHREAVERVLRSGIYTQGPEQEALEAWFGARLSLGRVQPMHAVAIANGTLALQCALEVLAWPGTKVLVPAATFTATALAVVRAGMIPVYVDVDEYGCMDPGLAAAALLEHGSRVRAAIPVDLDGHPADVTALREALPGVAIIQDSCPALGSWDHGSPAGALADAACYSFNQSKIAGCGEGGLVAFADPDAAAHARQLRSFGEGGPDGRWRSSQFAGTNWKLTEIQCALALASLDAVDSWAEEGRRNLDLMARAVQTSSTFMPYPIRGGVDLCPHKFRLRLQPGLIREEVEDALLAAGVPVLLLEVAPLPMHVPAETGCVLTLDEKQKAEIRAAYPRSFALLEQSVIVGSRTDTPWVVPRHQCAQWCAEIARV